MKIRFRSLKGVLVIPLLVACGGGEAGNGPKVLVEDAWARAMPLIGEEGGAGTNSAVYLTLRNESGVGDRLVGGRTAAAGALEIHESYLEGDVMRMRELDGVEIPPFASVELNPGGLHMMLLGIRWSLVEGDSLELLLRFEGSGEVAVSVPVRGAGGT